MYFFTDINPFRASAASPKFNMKCMKSLCTPKEIIVIFNTCVFFWTDMFSTQNKTQDSTEKDIRVKTNM